MQHYWVVSLQARSLQLYVQNKTYMTNAKKQKGEGATYLRGILLSCLSGVERIFYAVKG